MKPDRQSNIYLGITRSKAKMFEFNVQRQDHIIIRVDVTALLDLTIGILGDITFNINNTGNINNIEKPSILFTARYFDALLNSRLATPQEQYLKILGASAYTLAGYPGSAGVIVKDIGNINIESNELDKLLLDFLKLESINLEGYNQHSLYFDAISEISNIYNNFIKEGIGTQELLHLIANLRKTIYDQGSDKELLLIDIVNSITILYLNEMLWTTLPKYTGLSKDIWKPYIQRIHTIKKLWPAQILMGENDVFSGSSAVIQMPTSAGKTKAASLIIRSSFFSNRSRSAVIVAPFRALCQEIYNNFCEEFNLDQNINVSLVTDVLQNDIGVFNTEQFHIYILTPEKLEYILRQNAEIATKIGLIIYDEGHLLDDFSRGTGYELLLSGLKQRLNPSTQVVLISAVLPNAEQIGHWLIGETCKIVKGENLFPTIRNISFVSWVDAYGRLSFRNLGNYNDEDFFVPRILVRHTLQLKGKEKKERFFPNPDAPNQIALALSCQVVQNGAVAIFTGLKLSVSSMLGEITDAFNRGLTLEKPSTFSDLVELEKLSQYIKLTLGEDSVYHFASKIGFFAHHGSIPHGLRLSTEYALSTDKIRVVICTSTLAQGVNLPIRYLIVSSTYQAGESIKVRDFHNLMGRAGRSNKFTEGTVIFSNRIIHDQRNHIDEKWNWVKTLQLLEPHNTEVCRSRILSLFDPEPTYDKERDNWIKNMTSVIEDINSYLLNYLSEVVEHEDIMNLTLGLLKNTLAYNQANPEQRKILEELFIDIAFDIHNQEPSTEKRKIFAKSILSLEKAKQLSITLEGKIDDFNSPRTKTELLVIIFDIIYDYCPTIHKSIPKEKLLVGCMKWINGEGFPEIFNYFKHDKFGKRNATIEYVVQECEQVFGFEASLITGSVVEILQLIDMWNNENKNSLLMLQKMLKYGLPKAIQIKLYELGFTDRNLCISLGEIIEPVIENITEVEVISAIRNNLVDILEVVSTFPSYFNYVLNNIVVT